MTVRDGWSELRLGPAIKMAENGIGDDGSC